MNCYTRGERLDWHFLPGSRVPPLTFVGEHLNSLQLDLFLWAAWKPTWCRVQVMVSWQTTSPLHKEKSWCIAFANVCGVNTPTLVSFKLPLAMFLNI